MIGLSEITWTHERNDIRTNDREQSRLTDFLE
jgi:hypothetical protein